MLNDRETRRRRFAFEPERGEQPARDARLARTQRPRQRDDIARPHQPGEPRAQRFAGHDIGELNRHRASSATIRVPSPGSEISLDRKSVGYGKSLSVRVNLGGSRILPKTKPET